MFGAVLWYGTGDPRNTLTRPLEPGETASIYGSAVNFTRYMGSTASDQPLELRFLFGNEELVAVPQAEQVECVHPMTGQAVVADARLPGDVRGAFPVIQDVREVTDEDLPTLNYDAAALIINYQPASDGKAAVGDKFLLTIYGSALWVSVKNVGTKPVSMLRHYTRASVF